MRSKLSNVVKTRNLVWHGRRPVKASRTFARKVLREHPDWRKAKRSCPACRFDMLINNGHAIWCIRCGLMVPADSVYSIKTGRKVRF